MKGVRLNIKTGKSKQCRQKEVRILPISHESTNLEVSVSTPLCFLDL